MRRLLITLVLGQAALVVGFGIALRAKLFPLGVRGEWEWLRIPPDWEGTSILGGILALVGVGVYAGFAGIGLRVLSKPGGRGREVAWLAGLVGVAVGTQVFVHEGAPPGCGLSKWALALSDTGSSGYVWTARQRIDDPWRFLADYPEWIRHEETLHIGTHPPGLFLAAHVVWQMLSERPVATRFVLEHLPLSAQEGFRFIALAYPLTPAERATLAVLGMMVLLACSLTVVPLYLLARVDLTAPGAWASAVLWPLVPSAILFQPTADTAYPLLSTAALALTAAAARRRPVWALIAGFILSLGLMFSLVFLAVGLVVALILATTPGLSVRRRGALIALVGVGFLSFTLAAWVATGADPFVIWWWNLKHNERFYVEYPRSYLLWVLVNPIELMIFLGLAATLWVGLGLSVRRTPRAVWATLAVLALLNFSGRNLGEVARLWLPMMPPLLIASSRGLTRFGGGPWTLAATVCWMGLQTLILQATIQVVYPV